MHLSLSGLWSYTTRWDTIDLTGLPKDTQSILNLAAKLLFDVFAHASEGMLLVDRSGCVVWINACTGCCACG